MSFAKAIVHRLRRWTQIKSSKAANAARYFLLLNNLIPQQKICVNLRIRVGF